MRDLKPLTISNSINGKPSLLLTPSFNKFSFVRPIHADFILAQTLYVHLNKHFKIEMLEAAKFKLKQVNYLMAEEPVGIMNVDPWLDCLWTTKRKYNYLLNPNTLFKMYLIDLFFPIFGETKKLLLPGKKDRFVLDAYPRLSDDNGIQFKAINVNDVGMNKVEFKSLFSYEQDSLSQILEEFLILHHDNLYTDLKYQVSLYPEIRNKYWNELKKCFHSDFKLFVKTDVQNYLMKL